MTPADKDSGENRQSGEADYKAKEREAVLNKVCQALVKLKRKGFRNERIANDLGVSTSTLFKWMAHTRKPSLPTVRYMQSIYGVKIL